jgi:hypothetical protein
MSGLRQEGSCRVLALREVPRQDDSNATVHV